MKENKIKTQLKLMTPEKCGIKLFEENAGLCRVEFYTNQKEN